MVSISSNRDLKGFFKCKWGIRQGDPLSIAGRIQLVNFVIHSVLIFSFRIYSWPVSLIKGIESWCRNFIWSRDIHKRKLVTVAWKDCCQKIKAGGLGIRSIRDINEGGKLVQWWSIINGSVSWANILKARVFKNRCQYKYHVFLSIWTSCKEYLHELMENLIWMIGKGYNINLWLNNWCKEMLVNLLHIPYANADLLNASLSSILMGNSFMLPYALVQICSPSLCWFLAFEWIV